MNPRKTITATIAAFAVAGLLSACSPENQTPEPPTSNAPSQSATVEPSPEETSSATEPTETSSEPERDEAGNVIDIREGSVFDTSSYEIATPPGAVEAWGQELTDAAPGFALDLIFTGLYTTGGWEGERHITDYVFLTDMMLPETRAAFEQWFAGGDPTGQVFSLAPSNTRGDRNIEDTDGNVLLTVAEDFVPEIAWDGTFNTEAVANADYYGDPETRFVFKTTYTVTFTGTSPAGEPVTATEERNLWLALLPDGDGWGLERWGWDNKVLS